MITNITEESQQFFVAVTQAVRDAVLTWEQGERIKKLADEGKTEQARNLLYDLTGMTE